MQAMFTSASQALHFSYLIQAYEASPQSAMAILLRRHLEEQVLAEGDREASTVDFGDLNALEIRGQAAMIRLLVDTQLKATEAWAIKARYGITNIIERTGKPKAYSFSEERITAMRALSASMAPSYPSIPNGAVIWLIAKACGELEAVRPSFEDIAENVGGSKSELHRVYHKIRERLRSLENAGIALLEPIMVAEQII